MIVPYQPIRPVIASWALESVEAVGAVFFQLEDKAVNVIGSRLWRFESVANAIADLQSFPWRRRITVNIIPPHPTGVISELFELANLDAETCEPMSDAETVFLTRELFPVLQIDMAQRDWSGDEMNNAELVQSINGYRVELSRQAETYSQTPIHSWEKYLVRALELFAIWRYRGGDDAGGFLPKADYTELHKAVI